MALPARPRLKQGETIKSASFVKRMRAFNRAVALAEATKAKQEQDARESKERSERDVLSEVSGKAREKPAEPAEEAKPKAKPKKPGLIENVRKAFSSAENVKRIDSALEAVEGGIADADEDAKRKK